MSRKTKHAPVRIVAWDNSVREVECLAAFDHVIDGATIRFYVTRDYPADPVVTEARTGRKVCSLPVGVAYQPAYAHLGSYENRAKDGLAELIERVGEARVRVVIQSAPSLGDAKPVHYQTGRGTLCSLDNDASVREPTADWSTVTCPHCLRLRKPSTYKVVNGVAE